MNEFQVKRIDTRTTNRDGRSRGSALLMAVFVLALLATMGVILVFVSQAEVSMSAADAKAKQAFNLAESATEHAREQLRNDLSAAHSSAMTPRLAVAAGPNTKIDFDPATVRPKFSGDTLVGFDGVGDDVPIIAPKKLGDGWYAAFLTNDPADGVQNEVDGNEFVMFTGIGVGPDETVEMAQAIVQPGTIFPPFPAAITVLGPSPEFKLGSGKGWADIECPKLSSSKFVMDGEVLKGSKIRRGFNGTDCSPYRVLGSPVAVGSKMYPELVDADDGVGIPGMFVPTIGVVGSAAELDAEDEMIGSKMFYLSDLPVRTAVHKDYPPVGNYQDEDTVADLTDGSEPTVAGSGLGPLNATWQDCNAVKQVVEKLRTYADYECTPPGCSLPATTPSSVSFIDGDFRVDCDFDGYGILVVTGMLDFPASASWHGIVMAVGEGQFYRVKKDGFGNISGATLVADIAGPDNAYGTADDCTGGVNGFDSAYFEEQKKKAYGTTRYCSADIALADPGFKEPTVRKSFRQN